MNKVFKTVWNASLGVWVAVSETAAGQKKGSNKLKKAAANAVATVVVGAAAVASTGTMAYTNGHGTTSGSGAIAVGSVQGGATASGNNTTAIGTSSIASGQGATAVGKGANATGQNATSIGQDAKSISNSLAIGGAAQATGAGSTALGVGSKAQYESSLAVGNNVEAKGKNAIAIGATATGVDAIALGGAATGEEAISIGGIATGEEAISIGGIATGTQAISIGGEVLANQGIALGSSTVATDATYSVAIGYGNRIDSQNTFVLGSNITTSMQNSVLLGNKSELTEVYTSDVVSQAQYAYTAVDGTAQTGSKEVAFAGLYDPSKTELVPVVDANGNPVFDSDGNATFEERPIANPGAVSVGAVGAERQIQNVGAGRITSESTDAVNGSQLYYVLSEAKQAQADAAKPITFDDGKGGQATVKLGDTFNIEGATVSMVNGKPVLKVDAAAASAWTIKGTDAANQAVTGNVAKDNAVDFKAGDSNNLTVNTQLVEKPLLDDQGKPVVDANGDPVMTHDAEVVVELANNIKLDEQGSLEFGAKDQDGNIAAPTTTLDAAGLTLAADQGKGAITIQQGNVSFGGNQLHDVAVGTALTDAVNVSQLKDAVDTLGGGATVNPDGSINAPSYTVGAGDKTVNTVGDAIDVLNQGFTLTSSNATDVKSKQIQAGDTVDITVTKDKNLEVTQTGNKIEFALADDIQLTDQGALTIGNVPGTQIQIKQGDVSFGGNVLQNIGAGVNPTDAVNVSQLQSAGWNVITQDKDAAGNVTGTTENAVNGDKAANNSSVQFNGDDNISVSQTSKDVVDAAGNVVGSETIIAVELDKDVDLSADGSLTIGNTLLNDAGLTLAGATVGGKTYNPIIINQGNVNFGGNVLGGVAAGVADDDAVNVSQLKDEIGKAVGDSGWTLTTGGVAADQGEKIKPNTTVDFSGDGIGNIQVSNEGSNVKVELNPNLDLGKDGSVSIGDTLLNGEGLTVGGITIQEGNVNFAGDQLNNVGAATEDHQAVNLGQLKDELGGLENTINKNIDQSIANSGWNLTGTDAAGNTVSEKVNPDDTVEFVAGPSGNTTVTTETTPNGAKVTVDINDQLNLTGNAGSLTIGAGKGNDAITIQQGNVSVGGNQIHNLAAGTAGTDAVNVDQLKGTINIFGGGAAVNPDGSIQAPTYNVNGGSYDNVGDALGALNQADIDLGDRVTNLQQSFNNRIDDVEDRMSAGIAAAMALETAPYVPGKYTYAAATAYHNGQAALGVTLRKTADNGRWSLTGGVAAGTEGDPSVRLGVSGIID